MIRALIADDFAVSRNGAGRLLQEAAGSLMIEEAVSIDAVWEKARSGAAYDVVVFDWTMRGAAGFQTLSALCEAFPKSRLVIMSGVETRDKMLRAIVAGARAYIPKHLAGPEIVAAFERVLQGQIFIPSVAAEMRPARARQAHTTSVFGVLSPRQRVVLAELLKGKSTKQMAISLGVAVSTIKAHLAAIYRSLGVRTRGEALARFDLSDARALIA